MKTNIEGLLFDFGGTIDSNGQHWAVIIAGLYRQAGIQIASEIYEDAYVYGERKMARERIIMPGFNFRQTLAAKIEAQFEFLANNGIKLEKELITDLAAAGYQLAESHIQQAKGLLEYLRESYPMLIVSNFYGNLLTVLEDFGIARYFDEVIESAVVGVRKPDPAIYELGVARLGLVAGQCLVIGDSYAKDMEPGKACGCQTAWLKGTVWKEENDIMHTDAADVVIADIQEIRPLLAEK